MTATDRLNQIVEMFADAPKDVRLLALLEAQERVRADEVARVEVGDDARLLADARGRLDDRAFRAELLAFLGITRWADPDGV
mgnify:CR=1 FL=1